MTDVDCMACLVNLAHGLETDPDVWVEKVGLVHKGITHAAIYEMGPGRIRAACRYERVRGSRANRWQARPMCR